MWLKQITDNWPIIAVFAIISLMMICRVILFWRWLGKRRIARNFEKFEASLLDPDLTPNGSPFLTGETKLPTDVTIFLPGYKDGESLIPSIEEGLKVLSLGFLIRDFRVGHDLGLDVHLNDFVAGVDYLRNHLLEHDAPVGTIIEYDGGDLSIHD